MYHPTIERLLKDNPAFKDAFDNYDSDKVLAASNALNQAHKNPCCDCLLDSHNRTEEHCLLCWFNVKQYAFKCPEMDFHVNTCESCPCFYLVQAFRENILHIN